jgi:MSHA pilin protein MshA
MRMAGWLRRGRPKKSGFTLVEIIAVLVILAILTAVAVPKYFDLTAQARDMAVQGAVAEGLSVCSLAYAKKAMEAGGDPALADVVTEASGVSIEGDFTITFAANAGGTAIIVSVAGKAGSKVAGATGTGTWTMP